MQLITLTAEELELLRGEPADVMKMYVCLRRRMDLASREVGSVSGVSWWALREDMEVFGNQGRREHGVPTESMVRNKVERLERLGLVELRTHYRRLVVFMPKAHQVSERPKKVRRTCVGQVRQEVQSIESLATTSDSTEVDREVHRTEQAEVRHTSGIRLTPISVVKGIAAPCAQPVDNFQPDTVPVLAARFASWLRKAEHGRGKIAKVLETDTTVLAWAADGITQDQLQAAYSDACWDREKRNNAQPINAPFLDAILRRKLAGRIVGKREEAKPPVVMPSRSEVIERRAAELGLVRAEGESDDSLELRWMKAKDAQKGKPHAGK